MMSIGREFAIVCPSVITDKNSRMQLMNTLEKSNRTLVDISGDQMAAFAGNMLQVEGRNKHPYLLMSDTAVRSLENHQRKSLEKFATLLPASIPTIEKHGGGSVRCMVAEVFLEKNNSQKPTIISPTTTKEFEEYFALRWKILRAPWNQPAGSERDDQENMSRHFMAVLNKKVVAVGRYQEIRSDTVQIRFMAVDQDHHGKGYGTDLIQSIEAEALSKGYHHVFLQARENAVPFYLANGYKIIEKTFLLYNSIQHFSMEKDLV